MTRINFQNVKLKSNASLGEVIGHAFIWLLLSIVTLGVAFMLYPYSVMKLIINRTELVDRSSGALIGKLKCDITITSQIGHAIIWFFIGLFTLGLGFLVYFHHVVKFVLDNTEITN
jgi:hypothetical protein